MRVQEAMSFPPQVCLPGDTLADAAAVMDRQNCGVLPVLDDFGRPIGILTDRDICKTVASKTRSPGTILVREAMTPDPFSCPAGAPVEQALQIMASCHVRRLPVVDSRGKLVGIVSVTDLIDVLRDALDSDLPFLRRTLISLRRITHRPRERAAAVAIAIVPPPPAGKEERRT